MNSFKRQVSPGAAVFLVIVVLAAVQWVWWRGLVYKPPHGVVAPPPAPRGALAATLTLLGHAYITVDTPAGATDPGYVDGPGYAARFDRPTGLALDRTGRLYVCDTGNHRIRTMAPDGSVSTIAGSDQGFADGPAAQAKFNAPCGICLSPDGSIFVADTGNGKVRRIRDGQVTTVIRQNPSMNAAASFLPVAIEYRDTPTPHLLVLDAASKSLNLYDMDGKYRSGSRQLESAVIRSNEVVSSHNQADSTAAIPIAGAEQIPDAARRPALRHLTGWCALGSGALATDLSQSAVFYVKSGSADVLAGIVPSVSQSRGWRDGNGEGAFFSDVTCIVTDGVKICLRGGYRQ